MQKGYHDFLTSLIHSISFNQSFNHTLEVNEIHIPVIGGCGLSLIFSWEVGTYVSGMILLISIPEQVVDINSRISRTGTR